MTNQILNNEMSDRLSELDDVLDGVMGSIDCIFRVPLQYSDSTAEGVAAVAGLLVRIRNGLDEASMILGKIVP